MEKIILAVIVIGAILASGCVYLPDTDINTDKFCITDNQCVPATCCHATDVVNTVYSPDCNETVCTEECQSNTLDCGQGEIACVNNTCTVKFI